MLPARVARSAWQVYAGSVFDNLKTGAAGGHVHAWDKLSGKRLWQVAPKQATPMVEVRWARALRRRLAPRHQRPVAGLWGRSFKVLIPLAASVCPIGVHAQVATNGHVGTAAALGAHADLFIGDQGGQLFRLQ
jgi:hypothetical protein